MNKAMRIAVLALLCLAIGWLSGEVFGNAGIFVAIPGGFATGYLLAPWIDKDK